MYWLDRVLSEDQSFSPIGCSLLRPRPLRLSDGVLVADATQRRPPLALLLDRPPWFSWAGCLQLFPATLMSWYPLPPRSRRLISFVPAMSGSAADAGGDQPLLCEGMASSLPVSGASC
jgi:hypothetical protein